MKAKTRQLARQVPAIPVVPPAPPMRASLDIAVERLLLLADGAAAEASAAVKAGRVDDALRRIDQAALGLCLAKRAGADVSEREATLAQLRLVVGEIERLGV